MFLIAIAASLGIFGDKSIIFKDKSLTDATKAENSSSFELFLISFNSVILALK